MQMSKRIADISRNYVIYTKTRENKIVEKYENKCSTA